MSGLIKAELLAGLSGLELLAVGVGGTRLIAGRPAGGTTDSAAGATTGSVEGFATGATAAGTTGGFTSVTGVTEAAPKLNPPAVGAGVGLAVGSDEPPKVKPIPVAAGVVFTAVSDAPPKLNFG